MSSNNTLYTVPDPATLLSSDYTDPRAPYMSITSPTSTLQNPPSTLSSSSSSSFWSRPSHIHHNPPFYHARRIGTIATPFSPAAPLAYSPPLPHSSQSIQEPWPFYPIPSATPVVPPPPRGHEQWIDLQNATECIHSHEYNTLSDHRDQYCITFAVHLIENAFNYIDRVNQGEAHALLATLNQRHHVSADVDRPTSSVVTENWDTYGLYQSLLVQEVDLDPDNHPDPFIPRPYATIREAPITAWPNIRQFPTLYKLIETLETSFNPIAHVYEWKRKILNHTLSICDALLLPEAVQRAYEMGCWKCRAIGHIAFQCTWYHC